MSATPRLYVTSDLRLNGFVALDDAQAKYLTRVLRLKTGDPVRVFNGRDGEWNTHIDMVEGKTVLLKADAELKGQSSVPDLVLLFAPLKKTRTDYVVEKATEMGACAIQPVITERTQASRVRADRLQKIALEAAEQTERLDLPLVHEAKPLETALDDVDPGRTVFFCDEGAEDGSDEHDRIQPMLTALQASENQSAALLVGPEGGFSDDERAMLHARSGVVPVSLGPRVLRAETAVVAALALWEAVLGDWGE